MKAAKKASSINEIAKVHTRLVQSKDDLTAAEARHGEIENEYGDLLERFVVATAQQAGLMRLPPAVIQAGIHYLAVAGKDPSLVAEWNAAPGVPDAVSVSTDAEAGGVRSTGAQVPTSWPGRGHRCCQDHQTRRRKVCSEFAQLGSQVEWEAQPLSWGSGRERCR